MLRYSLLGDLISAARMVLFCLHYELLGLQTVEGARKVSDSLSAANFSIMPGDLFFLLEWDTTTCIDSW